MELAGEHTRGGGCGSIRLNAGNLTRGDSSIAEDEPVISDQIAGKVIRVENPEGKPVPEDQYLNKKPNYLLNRFLVRIISQFYRVKRLF